METSSSTSMSIAGDNPYLFSKSNKKVPRDSILTFAQKPGGVVVGGASGRGFSSSTSANNGGVKANPHMIEVNMLVCEFCYIYQLF